MNSSQVDEPQAHLPQSLSPRFEGLSSNNKREEQHALQTIQQERSQAGSRLKPNDRLKIQSSQMSLTHGQSMYKSGAKAAGKSRGRTNRRRNELNRSSSLDPLRKKSLKNKTSLERTANPSLD